MYGETFRVEGGKAHTLLRKYTDLQVLRTPQLARVKPAFFCGSFRSLAASLNQKRAFILWDFSFMKQKQQLKRKTFYKQVSIVLVCLTFSNLMKNWN